MIRRLTLSLLTVALAFACTPLQPSGGRPSPSPTADPVGFDMQLHIDPAQLLLLRESVESLRVRIYGVVSGNRGDQEGDDQTFALSADGRYTIRGIRVGWKDIVLNLLNARGEVVGEGVIRHLVGFGVQTLAPVTIQEVPPIRRRRDVDVSIFPRFNIPGSEPKTTFLDVKETLRANKCLNCHAPDYQPEPAGGLILTTFPFTSATFPTQPEIVADMITWMTFSDPLYRMPPPPDAAVPAAGVALFRKWIDDGLLANPPGSDQTDALSAKVIVRWRFEAGDETGEIEAARVADPARPFPGACRGLVIAGRYDFTVDVVAEDGRVVHSQTFEDQLVGESGGLELTVDVPYAEPVVDVPVIIVPRP